MRFRPFLSAADNSKRIIRNTFISSMVAFVVSSLTSSIGSLIDGVIIGQFLGVDALAAFGLISPIVIVFSLFGAVIAAGARNRFTWMVGNGDLEGARGVFSLSMLLGLGLSVLMMAAVFAFATPICVMLGATGSASGLLAKTRGYLLGIVVGLPAMNASRVLTIYMTIDNDRHLPMIASLALTVTDIVLDILIVTMGGDTFGIGLATSVSHCVALAVLLTHFGKKERLTRFSLSGIRWGEARRILSKGLPAGSGRVANTVRTVALNHLLASVSTAGCIAAFSLQRHADCLLNPFIFGVSDTVITLAGVLLGEENRPMLRRVTQIYVAISATVIAGIAALFWLGSPLFAGFFLKNDPEALQYGVCVARSYAVAMPMYALNCAYIGYLEGRGKVRLAVLGNILSDGAYILLAAWALFPAFGVDAVWYAFPAAQALLLVTLAIVAAAMNRREGTPDGDFWEWMMALPADFDVCETDRLDKTICSHEEVIALSQAAWRFCEDHGCDARRKYAIALAVEELATNTVVHGFRPGRFNTVDMRILKKGDDYILRVRDDCEIFDPVRQLQLYDQNAPMHHVGIRMALASAREVQYTTMLKLNNLVLRV